MRMDAIAMARWANSNGFQTSDDHSFRKVTETGDISLEIKRLSFVLIWRYRKEAKPRILTKMFKDMSDDMTPESLIPIR
jgi:hypothetical protein